MNPDEPSGNQLNEAPKTCTRCQGRGWIDQCGSASEQSIVCSYCSGRGTTVSGGECSGCHGTGRIETRLEEKNPCPVCGGAGVHPVPESMTYGEFAFQPGLKSK